MTPSLFRRWRRPVANTGDNLGRRGKESLIFPIPNPGRIFDDARLDGIVAFRPEGLALPISAALSLADQKLRGLLDLPDLRSAIIVFSSLDDGPLASHHRDLLWKAFGLPVFEQLLDSNGQVIARECEVHNGLHVAIGTLVELDGEELRVAGAASGITAAILKEQCECGAETPRLVNLASVPARAAAAAA